MSVNAVLDSIGQNLDGTYVAYVKLYKDGIFSKNVCIDYDPKNIIKFKTEIGKRLMEIEKIIETNIKPGIETALAEIVNEKTIEIAKAKKVEVIK